MKERSGEVRVSMRVLVVEDDPQLALKLVNVLRGNGHTPVLCRRGGDALARTAGVAVVLVDLDLADVDGHALLRAIRERASVAVLAISGCADELAVVRSLRSGADSHLAKPVRPKELLARIEAVGRRLDAPAAQDSVLSVDDLVIDFAARDVRVDGISVCVTGKEFDLLAILARNYGSAVSRRDIMLELWGFDGAAASRTLGVHMAGLRAKLGHPQSIRTVHGFGYRMG